MQMTSSVTQLTRSCMTAGVLFTAISSSLSIRRSDISLKVSIKPRKYLMYETASAEVHLYHISVCQRFSVFHSRAAKGRIHDATLPVPGVMVRCRN